ncbi:MAG: fatty acid--CoA ligase family protein [Gemmatimonadales bacterium]|jgi:O-succinylbenzoic acid--CoA ligase
MVTGRGAPDEWRLEAAAAEAGDRPALVAAGRTWTWRELAADAAREREALADAGVVPSETAIRATLDAHPTPATVIRLLALFEAGVCAVPLPPGLPEEARAERLRALGAHLDLETGVRVDPDPAAGSGAWRARPCGAGRHPLAVLFTSGSSGTPRAVELSREAFSASAAASARHLGWRPGDRWLCCLPLFHVGGLSIVTRCLLGRRTVVLADGFDAVTVAAMVERESVSLASFVPTMLHRLFELEPEWTPPAGLRAVLLGGAPASEQLWREIERRGLRALSTYGMTETCSQVATGTRDAPRRLVPLDGVRLRIRSGRIEVAGPMLATRVRAGGDEEPFTPDGYLRCGDLGRIESGSLEVLGRSDRTILTGGENVAPAEVETVLERHPGIRRAVVFGVPDEEWGQVVGAALEPTDAPVPAEELRDWLAGRLAGHQRPRRVAWLTELPLTPTGKVDRAAAERAGSVRASVL